MSDLSSKARHAKNITTGKIQTTIGSVEPPVSFVSPKEYKPVIYQGKPALATLRGSQEPPAFEVVLTGSMSEMTGVRAGTIVRHNLSGSPATMVMDASGSDLVVVLEDTEVDLKSTCIVALRDSKHAKRSAVLRRFILKTEESSAIVASSKEGGGCGARIPEAALPLMGLLARLSKAGVRSVVLVDGDNTDWHVDVHELPIIYVAMGPRSKSLEQRFGHDPLCHFVSLGYDDEIDSKQGRVPRQLADSVILAAGILSPLRIRFVTNDRLLLDMCRNLSLWVCGDNATGYIQDMSVSEEDVAGWDEAVGRQAAAKLLEGPAAGLAAALEKAKSAAKASAEQQLREMRQAGAAEIAAIAREADKTLGEAAAARAPGLLLSQSPWANSMVAPAPIVESVAPFQIYYGPVLRPGRAELEASEVLKFKQLDSEGVETSLLKSMRQQLREDKMVDTLLMAWTTKGEDRNFTFCGQPSWCDGPGITLYVPGQEPSSYLESVRRSEEMRKAAEARETAVAAAIEAAGVKALAEAEAEQLSDSESVVSNLQNEAEPRKKKAPASKSKRARARRAKEAIDQQAAAAASDGGSATVSSAPESTKAVAVASSPRSWVNEDVCRALLINAMGERKDICSASASVIMGSREMPEGHVSSWAELIGTTDPQVFSAAEKLESMAGLPQTVFGRRPMVRSTAPLSAWRDSLAQNGPSTPAIVQSRVLSVAIEWPDVNCLPWAFGGAYPDCVLIPKQPNKDWTGFILTVRVPGDVIAVARIATWVELSDPIEMLSCDWVALGRFLPGAPVYCLTLWNDCGEPVCRTARLDTRAEKGYIVGLPASIVGVGTYYSCECYRVDHNGRIKSRRIEGRLSDRAGAGVISAEIYKRQFCPLESATMVGRDSDVSIWRCRVEEPDGDEIGSARDMFEQEAKEAGLLSEAPILRPALVARTKLLLW